MCPGYNGLKIGSVTYSFNNPPSSAASCVPYGDATKAGQGGYIMYPSTSNNQDSPYIAKFSSCTRTAILDTLQAQGGCLTELDPCAQGGACCSNGRLSAKGTACRAADPTEPCKESAYCDGARPTCPENAFKPDEAPCDTDTSNPSNHGVCHSGVCSHIHAAYCHEFLRDIGSTATPSCSIPGFECVRACKSFDGTKCYIGSDWSGCRAADGLAGLFDAFKRMNGYTGRSFGLFSNSLPNKYKTCTVAPSGTPCTTSGSNGLCNTQGSCVKCQSKGCGGAGVIDPPPSPPATPVPSPPVTPSPSKVDCKCPGWGRWGQCTKSGSPTCGTGGSQTRTRTCTGPQNGGRTCAQLGLKDRDARSCTLAPCPVDCKCGAYSGYTACSGGGSSCQAPAARSRKQCETCFLDSQCPAGFYCCPYMRKCVLTGSMSCYGEIADCNPRCYDSSCTAAAGCTCTGCKNVGVGKKYSWLEWGSLAITGTFMQTYAKTCSPTGCGTGGTKSRTRTCVEQQNGGKTCVRLGLKESDTTPCSLTACAAVDCSCGDWLSSGNCERTTCGNGMQKQTRVCKEGAAGGETCAAMGVLAQRFIVCKIQEVCPNQANQPTPIDPSQTIAPPLGTDNTPSIPTRAPLVTNNVAGPPARKLARVLKVGSWTKYFDYAGPLADGIAGTIYFAERSNGTLYANYDLAVNEATAAGGFHIHTGIDCAVAAGPHYWNDAALGSADPWTPVKWVSNSDSRAKGTFLIETGFGYDANVGHTVVLHSANGTKIACGILSDISAGSNLAFDDCSLLDKTSCARTCADSKMRMEMIGWSSEEVVQGVADCSSKCDDALQKAKHVCKANAPAPRVYTAEYTFAQNDALEFSASVSLVNSSGGQLQLTYNFSALPLVVESAVIRASASCGTQPGYTGALKPAGVRRRNRRSCVDYSVQGYWASKKRIEGLPDSTYVSRPPSMSACELEQLHQDCIDRINLYRSGALKFSDGTVDTDVAAGVKPLTEATGANQCSSESAMGDLKINVAGGGGCAGSHANSFTCGAGGQAQNSCCARGGGSFGSRQSVLTYADTKKQLFDCLQSMWDEGITPGQKGHWKNMKGVYAHGHCGFAWNTGGRVFMIQDFSQASPGNECNCEGKVEGAPDGCGGTCSCDGKVGGGCSGGSAATKATTAITDTASSPSSAATDYTYTSKNSFGHCCKDGDDEKLAFADGVLQLNDQADDTACRAACDGNSACKFYAFSSLYTNCNMCSACTVLTTSSTAARYRTMEKGAATMPVAVNRTIAAPSENPPADPASNASVVANVTKTTISGLRNGTILLAAGTGLAATSAVHLSFSTSEGIVYRGCAVLKESSAESARSPTGQGLDPGASGGTEEDSGDSSGVVVGIVIVLLLIGAGGVAFIVYRRKGVNMRPRTSSRHKTFSNNTSYEMNDGPAKNILISSPVAVTIRPKPAIGSPRTTQRPPTLVLRESTHMETSSTDTVPTHRLLYVFNATNEGELTTKEGEEVQAIGDATSEWCEVESLTGQRGFVPGSYLAGLVQNQKPDADGVKIVATNPRMAILESKTVDAPETAAASSPSESGGTVCLALWEWKATSDAEISFAEGDQVLRIEEELNGWSRGRSPPSSSVEGLFPSNYVKLTPIQDKQAPASASRPSLEASVTHSKPLGTAAPKLALKPVLAATPTNYLQVTVSKPEAQARTPAFAGVTLRPTMPRATKPKITSASNDEATAPKPVLPGRKPPLRASDAAGTTLPPAKPSVVKPSPPQGNNFNELQGVLQVKLRKAKRPDGNSDSMSPFTRRKSRTGSWFEGQPANKPVVPTQEPVAPNVAKTTTKPVRALPPSRAPPARKPPARAPPARATTAPTAEAPPPTATAGGVSAMSNLFNSASPTQKQTPMPRPALRQVGELKKSPAKPPPSTKPVLSSKPPPPRKPVVDLKPVLSSKPPPPRKPVLSSKPPPPRKPVLSSKPPPPRKPVAELKPVLARKPPPPRKPILPTKPVARRPPARNNDEVDV